MGCWGVGIEEHHPSTTLERWVVEERRQIAFEPSVVVEYGGCEHDHEPR